MAMRQNGVIERFFICPKSNNKKHVCDFAQLPFQHWYRNITIFKSICANSSEKSAWNNKTALSGCDRTWQSGFIKKQPFCNFTSNEATESTQRTGYIRPTSLQGLIWTIALTAISGNLLVLFSSLRNLQQAYESLTEVQRIHYILVINLATADFCMGVYMLSIAGIAIHYNGPNCHAELITSMGGYCTFLGVLNLVSSQMSVTLLVMLTSFHLFCVVRPYRAVRTKFALTLTTTAWVFWIAVACIPILPIEPFQDVFSRIGIGTCDKTRTTNTWEHERFKNMLQNFVEQLGSSCTSTMGFSGNLFLSPSIDMWESVAIANHTKLINGDFLKISYYMEQNHCSPRYFFNGGDPAKVYGLLVLVYNFVAFLYIMNAYISIGMKTSQCKVSSVQCSMSEFVDGTDAARQKENTRLQRKIFLIITTDFFCWVPKSIVAFFYAMYVNDSKISSELCKFVVEWKQPLSTFSLVTVSINSAFNPLLYSSAPIKLLRVLMKVVGRESREHDRPDNPDLSLPHFHTSNLSQLPGISLPYPH